MDTQPAAATPGQIPGSGQPRRYACSVCGYNLVGVRIGDPCPECGKLFLLSEASHQRAGAAVASMVLGILSLIGCLFYGVPGLICGIVAVVMAKKAREAVRVGEAPAFSLDFAKAGRICGWIGISLSVLFFLLIIGYLVLVVSVFGAMAGGGVFNPPPGPTPVPMPSTP